MQVKQSTRIGLAGVSLLLLGVTLPLPILSYSLEIPSGEIIAGTHSVWRYAGAGTLIFLALVLTAFVSVLRKLAVGAWVAASAVLAGVLLCYPGFGLLGYSIYRPTWGYGVLLLGAGVLFCACVLDATERRRQRCDSEEEAVKSLRTGVVVQLKSGGPNMTVREGPNEKNELLCEWFPDPKSVHSKSQRFLADTLRAVGDDKLPGATEKTIQDSDAAWDNEG